jgi:hypothetical protein
MAGGPLNSGVNARLYGQSTTVCFLIRFFEDVVGEHGDMLLDRNSV